MPIASPPTAAPSSLHPHQRSAQSARHADKGASSPFSELIDSTAPPNQAPAPRSDAAPREAAPPRRRDQAPAAKAGDNNTAPADKASDSPADTPAESTDQPVTQASDAATTDKPSTNEDDTQVSDPAAEQTAVVDPTLIQPDPTAIVVAPVITPPTPPAAPIMIPTVIADAPAGKGAAADQIAAATDDGAPPTPKTGLSPLADKAGETSGDKKTGDATTPDKSGKGKAAAPATTDQPTPSDTGKAATANPATNANAAPADGDGDGDSDKKVDAEPHHVGADKATRHASEPADTARGPGHAAAAGDTRSGSLHLVSTDSNNSLQALGAAAPGISAAAATGQAAKPEAVSAAVPIAAVAVEIAARAQAGSNRFEIRLDPPELGRIDVRLDVDRNGNVTSRLIADRGDTLDLLRREAPQLERALQDAGLKTGDNGLQFSLRDQGTGADRNAREPAPTNAPQVDAPEADPLPVEAVRSYRWSGAAGGIDIRV